ncbi:hypothetical protein CC79DRAFT_619022 [Sarocladium strictum]
MGGTPLISALCVDLEWHWVGPLFAVLSFCFLSLHTRLSFSTFSLLQLRLMTEDEKCVLPYSSTNHHPWPISWER